MSSYNRLAGEYAAENRRLLTDILRTEWGFDGFVVSDWFGVHEPVGAANAGLTLEMPGPGPRVRHMASSKPSNTVTSPRRPSTGSSAICSQSMNRTKADERSCDETGGIGRRSGGTGAHPTGRDRRHGAAAQCPRRVARACRCCRSRPVTSASVAVVGPNAVIDRSMGGGSASLTPFAHRTLLDALTDRLAARSSVDHRQLRPGRPDRSTHADRASRTAAHADR